MSELTLFSTTILHQLRVSSWQEESRADQQGLPPLINTLEAFRVIQKSLAMSFVSNFKGKLDKKLEYLRGILRLKLTLNFRSF